MELNDNKAGMKGLDKEKINKIIQENSVGSKFYQNELKKNEQIKERIDKMIMQYKQLTKEEKRVALTNADNEAALLDLTRDLSRTIVHVDMDAFYASVEERDQPDLKTKPMAVGGTDMLSTSNYIARRFGVRAAMPGFIAKKLCPELVIVPTNFKKYTEVSLEIREVLFEYDPDMTPMSLDEAYLDITEYLAKRRAESMETILSTDENKFQTLAEEVVDEMRMKIFMKTQLTASAGIASNALLAKVASDMNKPNGQFYLPPDRTAIIEFVKILPIRKVGGIGKVTQSMLEGLGIRTCGDLYEKRMELFALFSPTMSNFFLRTSLGIGMTHFTSSGERKSVSTERTFPVISTLEAMLDKLDELCESLEIDLKSTNTQGLTLTLKYKTSEFKLRTRSKTLSHPVKTKQEILPIAIEILKKEFAANKNNLKVRLLGVGMSKLSKTDEESEKKSIIGFFKKQEMQRKENSVVEAECSSKINDVIAQKMSPKSDKNSPKKRESVIGFFKKQELLKKENNVAVTCPKQSNEAEAAVDQKSIGFFRKRELKQQQERASKLETSATSVDCTGSIGEERFLINEKINEENLDPAPDHHKDDDMEELFTESTEAENKQSLDESFTCPSCETMRFKSIAVLNVHLDKCASKSHDIDDNSNSSELELASTSQYIVCPICNGTFSSEDMDLNKFNAHVDSCLNRQTIKEIVQSDRRHTLTPPKSAVRRKSGEAIRPNKKQKLDKTQCKISDFFNG